MKIDNSDYRSGLAEAAINHISEDCKFPRDTEVQLEARLRLIKRCKNNPVLRQSLIDHIDWEIVRKLDQDSEARVGLESYLLQVF